MENKYTIEDLRTMQAWPLHRKIQVSQTRIIEWYQRNNGKVVVSFSGGKDSTVLLDLVRRIYPDVMAVYVDTGLEYPELREFVKTIPQVTWLKPSMNFRKVIETYGYPLWTKQIAHNVHYGRRALERGDLEMYDKYIHGYRYSKKNGEPYTFMAMPKRMLPVIDSGIKVSDNCCYIMKKKPLKAFQKSSGTYPFLGTLAEESMRRTDAWLKNGCNAFDSKRPTSQPLSFWTDQDILQYLKEFNIPYASVYGEILQGDNGKLYTTGCKRTGCIFCGFGAHLEKEPNRFQMLKETHPKLHNYCMRPTDDGGLGMAEVLDLIGVKH